MQASLFKEYDIRGIVPSTLNPEIVEAIGLAWGSMAWELGERTVAVGRDGRLSGPSLSEALIKGLVAAGMQVLDVGMVTTPMLYFAAHTLCQSGIEITGSHNPKDYNGLKMVLAGSAMYGAQIQQLRECAQKQNWTLRPGGQVRQVDVFPAYQTKIQDHIRLARPMKVVVDSGNGVAGAWAPQLLRVLGCEVVELFSEVDGNFPNHHPDPSRPENLNDLKAAIQTHQAELGLAFDGDGDRLGVVTVDGNTIDPDRQLMLFAQDVLTRVPGATIVYDVKCTQRLAPAITAAGGVPLMHKTGHSLIKAKMKEIDSPLGGEMSGHIFFKERWLGFDDALYAAARLLEIVSRSSNPSELLNALPTSFATPELNIACEQGHEVVRQIQAQAQFDAPAQVSHIDGLRVDWPDGFGLIRASNTTPVLVLRFEGHSPQALQRIKNDMLAVLPSDLSLPQ